MNRRSFSLAVIFALAFSVLPAGAVERAEIYTGRFSNLAAGGYDPVAYFTQGAPAKGSADFVFDYKGAQWRFASAENRTLFMDNPAAYAPQYGGYCAWAMAQGKFAKGDPRYWNIVDGKLYLNFSASIQKKWEADIPGFIAKADAIWPGILAE